MSNAYGGIGFCKEEAKTFAQLLLHWDHGMSNGRQIKSFLWRHKFPLGCGGHVSKFPIQSLYYPWPNRVASRPKFSTCIYLRPRLSRALNWSLMTIHDHGFFKVQLQTCLPGVIIEVDKQTRSTLKTVQPNSFSKTSITISFNLLHFLSILTFFTFCCIIEMFLHPFLSGHFYVSLSIRRPFFVKIWLKSVAQFL